MIEYVTIIYMPYALCITGRGIIGWVDIPPKGGRFSVGCFFDSRYERPVYRII